jgi:hypothetical protein
MKPIPRYRPVSTRQRAAGMERHVEGDYLLAADVKSAIRRYIRALRALAANTETLEALLGRID